MYAQTRSCIKKLLCQVYFMKKMLNTLYVTTQHSYLKKEGESIVVIQKKKIVLRLPLHTIDGIITFGAVSISPYLVSHYAKNDVTISHFSKYGHFLARVHGPVAGNVLLRREQYRYADDDFKSEKIVRYFIFGKIHNSRSVIRRVIRDHPEKVNIDKCRYCDQQLTAYLKKIQREFTVDSMRGMEGEAAREYFS